MIQPSARGAYHELHARLRPFVARRVAAADVDDVVQDVFLRMHRHGSGLRDAQRFGPWVYQVARSAVADHHRAAARHPLAKDPPPELPADPDETEDAVTARMASYVAPLVSLLPPVYREAVSLTELEGLTQREAAARLGISLSAMKSRVQRGRAMVRGAIEACCEVAQDARGRVVACEPRAEGVDVTGCCG